MIILQSRSWAPFLRHNYPTAYSRSLSITTFDSIRMRSILWKEDLGKLTYILTKREGDTWNRLIVFNGIFSQIRSHYSECRKNVSCGGCRLNYVVLHWRSDEYEQST